MSKNITLTVDEEVLRKARILAAERRTSINALVRDFLNGLVEKERTKDDARAALLRLARERQGDMGSKISKREDLYDR